MRTKLLIAGACILAAGAAIITFGDGTQLATKVKAKLQSKHEATAEIPPPAVTVARVKTRTFVETVMVTGSLVARDEIVVAPEVEGLRTVELRFDEGDRVEAGDVLAVLENQSLKYQLDQREAALKRATAAIAQSEAQINEAKARLDEAEKSLERAKPLRRKKYIAESVIDQRRAAALSAKAQLASAEEGLRVAQANKSETEAQRRDLAWRVSRTEVKAPISGLISKRNARVGEIAIGANAFSGDAPMFRLIARGEVELDAEVPETEVAKVRSGQTASVDVAGVGTVQGTVRLVSPEIDKTTRLGQVRIFLGDNPQLKLGSFGRGRIETRTSNGLAVPLSAVMYSNDGSSVLVVENGVARSRKVETGLTVDGFQEATAGLQAGDLVVAKSGTFLRDGDAVNPVLPEPQVSEAAR